jgi:hypothetical protein
MAKNTLEVLIGTGTLYVAEEGTAFPADPFTSPGGGWRDIGYSEEGWSFNLDRDTEDVEVAEEIDPIDVLQTSREIHLVGEAAQASLENLALALGGGTITPDAGPPATRRFTPAGTGDLDRIAVLFRGKAPRIGTADNVRDVQMSHAIAVGAVEYASKKAPDKSLIAIDFRVIKVTGDEIFEIVDTVESS